MTQEERRFFLIRRLLDEQPQYKNLKVPQNAAEQKILFRALFNVRMPDSVTGEFSEIQDAYLQEETATKGITELADLQPVQDGLYLWQGGYYNTSLRSCRQRRKFQNARLFLSLPRMH